MSFAQNEDVKIHYQVEGKGSPIILITGFPGLIDFWLATYSSYSTTVSLDNSLDYRGFSLDDKEHSVVGDRGVLYILL